MASKLLLVFLIACGACAQTALTGRILDETGALIPGAKVVLTGSDAAAQNTVAGADGTYSFTAVPAGNYTVTASAPGLAMAQPVKIALRGAAQKLDLQLKLATATQALTVRDNMGPTVSTEASNNASALVLRGDDLAALSDDPDDLAADLQALAGPSAGPNGGAIFIDGFSGGQIPPKESIREIRINQNPFSPEYDKLGYGRIEIFTKPGTDKFHGTVQYNFADDVFNARNPYAATKAPLVLNEFENSFSGPLGKRASFTLDVERHSVDNGSVINAVTLDPATLASGAFTGVVTSAQRRLRISPRVDYQLNTNNTLSVRYSFVKTDIPEAGIGGFDLETRGYRSRTDYNTVQATETAVLGASVNETRFQYFRAANDRQANSNTPELQVLGAFNGGGAQTGHSTDVQNSYELQNYTSVLRGAHSWRFGVRLRQDSEDSVLPKNFGGTFTFPSIDVYRLTLLLGQAGDTPVQIRAMGGGASQFSIATGIPGIAGSQRDLGVFAGDDWRVRPNVTLSIGIRYEAQTRIHDYADFAPRIGVAWAPGGTKKTVVRGGFGMFYDRFALTNSLTAARYNGLVQQQFVVTNPDTYPNAPAIGAGAVQSKSVIQEVDSHLRAPYVMQSAVTVERQLPANTTVAVTYTNSRAVRVLRSEDIDAPLPGTYNPAKPAIAPPIFLMTASGVYNQNQLIANVNSKVNAQISLFGFYVLNRAMSNSDGLGTFRANPYSDAGEYGPAGTDIRHRFLVGGSINNRWNVRLSPYITAQSGAPFDITTGSDLYGTTLFNGRPGIATDPTRPGLIATRYGLLDPNPIAGEKLLGRNFGRGPGQITVNLRVGKTIGFGPLKEGASASSGGGRPAGAPPLSAPGGMHGLFSPPSTAHRYNLTIGVSGRNILNHNNPGPIIGNVTSPLFGNANQIAGTPNGEGFSEAASNRRFELQVRFQF
jgi:hypothetical protein